jgi:hypothetical protein
VIAKIVAFLFDFINMVFFSITGQSGIDGLLSYKPSPKWPFEKYIRFDPPFTATPSFVYGISELDFEHKSNSRAMANIRSLTRTGVVLYLNTWADTVMFGIRNYS